MDPQKPKAYFQTDSIFLNCRAFIRLERACIHRTSDWCSVNVCIKCQHSQISEVVKSQVLNCSEDTEPGGKCQRGWHTLLTGRTENLEEQQLQDSSTMCQIWGSLAGGWPSPSAGKSQTLPAMLSLAGAPPGEMPGGQGLWCSLYITLGLQVASFTPGVRRAQSWSSLNERMKCVQLSKLQWYFPQMVGRGYWYSHGSCCSCKHFPPVGNSSLQPSLHVPSCQAFKSVGCFP